MKKKVAFLILRIGLGAVFLLFGIGKFRNDIWAQTMKNMDFFLHLPWNVDLSVFVIGISEILTGIALILGIFTRFFAILAAAQLTGILILLKLGEIRDIGLLGASLYIAIAGNNSFGIDRLWKK